MLPIREIFHLRKNPLYGKCVDHVRALIIKYLHGQQSTNTLTVSTTYQPTDMEGSCVKHHLLLSLTVDGDDDVTVVAMTMTANTLLLGTVMRHDHHGNMWLQ